jgi:hypothetical protein
MARFVQLGTVEERRPFADKEVTCCLGDVHSAPACSSMQEGTAVSLLSAFFGEFGL